MDRYGAGGVPSIQIYVVRRNSENAVNIPKTEQRKDIQPQEILISWNTVILTMFGIQKISATTTSHGIVWPRVHNDLVNGD